MAGLLLTTALSCFWIGIVLECVADTSWSGFGTSPYYRNYKMKTAVENAFDPRYMSKETPLLWAKMDCAQSCAKYATCLSFNFYETASDYVCELLPDNYCQNLASKVLLPSPGNLLFDKLSDGATTSCFEARFSSTTGFDCKILRPGCLGTWPNCTSCVKSSMDASARYGAKEQCIVWPDGDAPSSVPIFGRCYGDAIFLIYRTVDSGTGKVTNDYRMSFPDMNRLYKLGVYRQLRFFFTSGLLFATGVQYRYLNSYIDANGTLMNMTFTSAWYDPGDAFNLNGKPIPPTPFVTVLDDRYGCGSFWLLDPDNATYCPGGKISMQGEVKFDGATVKSSGIRCPSYGPSVVPVETNLLLMS